MSSSEKGLTSSDECTPVPRGKYANASNNAMPCPIGQYQDEEGKTSCKLCTAGRYNDNDGQTSCDTLCDVGKYSLQGASFCTDCPLGMIAEQGASKCDFEP